MVQRDFQPRRMMNLLRQPALWTLLLLVGLVPVAGCGGVPEAEAQDQSGAPQGEQAPAVNVAIARPESLKPDLEYTGTTQPVREVSLRSQVEGRVLNIRVEAGDRVRRGQTLAQLDDSLQQAAVSQSQAELAAQQAEVASAQAEVSNAQTQVADARIQLQQAQADLDRAQRLYREGAIAEQDLEVAQTELRTAQQAVAAAQAQVQAQQQAVAAAQQRVEAQRAIVAEGQERRSFTQLTAPVSGVVLQRVTEPGNLAQPGSEILKIGDFSQVQVLTQVSELDLADILIGQSVQVRLDAFPDQVWTGRVTNISPAADPTARLVPIEVTIPNPEGRIGSGLLARVNFSQEVGQPIVIPLTALEAAGESPEPAENTTATVFVVEGEGEAATVAARSVRLGQQADGRVEVVSGLEREERYVARSSQPLTEGQSVRLSIISEQSQESSQQE